MKLLVAGPSPFVRKVSVLIEETGQSADVERINVMTVPVKTDPAVAQANPIGKIPALIRDDGPALYDSRVICQYLDARAQAGLYAAHAPWDTQIVEATGDGLMDAAVSMSYEVRLRPAELVWEPWLDAQWGKITNTLDALQSHWMAHLNGPLDMGQISVACALGYLDLRHDARGWRTDHDALADWFAEFAQRDSMKATEPEV